MPSCLKEVIIMKNHMKVLNTLADETRFQIYDFILKHKKSYTVQDIADQFSIHPNVARLHLTKLCEIGIVQYQFEKSGKGGRPGRVYKASEEGIVLSFPKRDDNRILKWALKSFQLMGQEAVEIIKTVSYEDGFNEMTNALNKEASMKHSIEFDDKLQLLTKSVSLIGYIPSVIQTSDGKKLMFTIYNCPFKENLSENENLICTIHESFIKGQVDALFEQHELIQIDSMINNCDNCMYQINLKD